MVDVADVDLTPPHARSLRLGVATQAQVHIPLKEELGVDRTMRVVANDASLS